MQAKPPVGQVLGKKVQVEQMFDAVAHRYDLLNRVLSMGIDQGWRKRAMQLLAPEKPQQVLDVATGTADLALMAFKLLRPKKIVGVDISEGMLALGREKIAERGLSDFITLQKGDSEALPFEAASFDAAMVSFGVRNFENLAAGLSEIRRVLKPNAKLMVLEFSRPKAFPIKQLYNFYFKNILPKVGGTVSGVKGAYEYLNESAMQFPDGEAFLTEMRNAGFKDLYQEPKTFGIATIYVGKA